MLNLPIYGQLLQGYRMQPINNQDALPTKQINCIFQDKDGFIWLGTSEGICRYDGYSLKTYKSSYLTPNLLNSNFINCITEDKYGKLWIGTPMGLNVFDKRHGEIRPVNIPALQNNFVNTILYTSKQQLWIGTENGLFLYNDTTDTYRFFLTDENNDHSLPGNRIRALCEDINGNLWVGFWKKGFCNMDIKSFDCTPYPIVSARNSVNAIFLDNHKDLWLAAWDEGVYLAENVGHPDAVKYQRLSNPSHYEKLIFSFSSINDNQILVGTGLGMDLIVKTPSGIVYHSSEEPLTDGLPNNSVKHLCSGTNGILWIATQNNGAHLLFKEEQVFTNHKYQSSINSIHSLSMNAFTEWNDDILIGVDNVGLVRFKKNGEMIAGQEDTELRKIPFPMGNIKCFAKHPSKNELTIGSEYGGVFKYEWKGEKIISAQQFYVPDVCTWLISNIVSTLCYDTDENLWMGTDEGLNILTNALDTLIYDKHKIGKVISINCILQDSKGRVWIGTDSDGIIEANTKKGLHHIIFEEYSVKNGGIDINKIECIYEDTRQRLWAGTNGGCLCLYNEKNNRFERVRGINEFSGDAILSILEYNGILYMGTYQGLLQYNPDGEEGSQLIIFTVTDGLLDNAFNRNAAMVGSDGRLYFGTPQGFVSFNPNDLRAEVQKKQLVLSDMKLFHNSIDKLPPDALNRLSPDGHPGYTRQIVLSHKDYHFGIEFATLSYKHPEKNRYAYMLEGFDKDWNYVNAQNRSAYYTNLKSGNYRFKVISSNENSYMQVEPEILEIIVLPPPYLSKWAFFVYIIILIFFVYWIIRSVRHRARRRMHEFEHIKNEELAQEKIKFFTNISHELLTPLTIINCSVEELQRKYNDHGKGWNAIRGNIFRLNRLLEQILEFRKAEKGKLRLSLTFGDIGGFVTDLCERYFSQYSMHQQIEFEYQSLPRYIPAWYDKNAIDMIVYNLVSNAFKYNKKNGKVKLEIKAEGNISDCSVDYAIIIVGNTGHGFTQEQIRQLFGQFQPFPYTGNSKSGNGIGLFLVKSLTELHKGEISVNSIPDVWTEFVIKLPVQKSVYQNELIQEEKRQTIEPFYSTSIPTLPYNHADAIKEITILLIEDDYELLSSLSNLLKTNYHVLAVSRGDEGFNVALAENPDLIISDVLLPGMNGFDLCEKLKNELETSHIPIILLTAKITPEDQRKGYESGADAYITKPFDFNVMVSQIESILLNRRLINERFRHNLQTKENIKTLPKADQIFIEKAIHLVECNINDVNFDTESFRNGLNLSKSTLYRKIKATTNLGPNEFIRNIRLKKACELLENRENTISEIAYMVGFNDAKYFTYCFKKEFKKTPSEYQYELSKSNKAFNFEQSTS